HSCCWDRQAGLGWKRGRLSRRRRAPHQKRGSLSYILSPVLLWFFAERSDTSTQVFARRSERRALAAMRNEDLCDAHLKRLVPSRLCRRLPSSRLKREKRKAPVGHRGFSA